MFHDSSVPTCRAYFHGDIATGGWIDIATLISFHRAQKGKEKKEKEKKKARGVMASLSGANPD